MFDRVVNVFTILYIVISSPDEPPLKFFLNSWERLRVATPSALTDALIRFVPWGSGFSNPEGGVDSSLNIALIIS